MIKPTIGRIVHFYETSTSDPCTATICRVWNDRMVNLRVIHPNGDAEPKTSVTLRQPDDEVITGAAYCEWMPYQVKKDTGSESGEKEAGTTEI